MCYQSVEVSCLLIMSIDALNLFPGICFPKDLIIYFQSSLQIVTESGITDQMRLTELILKDVSN